MYRKTIMNVSQVVFITSLLFIATLAITGVETERLLSAFLVCAIAGVGSLIFMEGKR